MRRIRSLPFAIAVTLAIADYGLAGALPASAPSWSAAAPATDVLQARFARGGHRGRAVAVRRGPRGKAVAVRGRYGGRAVAVRGRRGGTAVAVSGRHRVGARYYGGVWYGPRRHYWRGRWWAYGVGSCWRSTPIGYVWICG